MLPLPVFGADFTLTYILKMWWSCASSRWAWVLQDTLGIAFCLYMLKTVRLPTFKVLQLFQNKRFFHGVLLIIHVCCKLSCLCSQACTLLLSVLFVYDVFFVFITPFLTNVRHVRSQMHVRRLPPLLPCYA